MRYHRFAAVACLVSCLAVAPARGAVITPFAIQDNYAWQWMHQANFADPLQFDQTLAQSSQPFSITSGGSTYGASSVAAFGSPLRAQSSMQMRGYTPSFATTPPPNSHGYGVTVTAVASLADTLSFTNVVPSVVRLHYAVTGTRQNTAYDGVDYLSTRGMLTFSGGQISPFSPSVTLYDDRLAGNGTQTDVENLLGFYDIPITSATPVAFRLSLSAISTMVDHRYGDMWGTVSADYGHTVRYGLQALDASGRDITREAGFVFASGATYATTVPEPGLGLVLLVGLVPSLWRRRRTDAA